jgi:hypothetical protein
MDSQEILAAAYARGRATGESKALDGWRDTDPLSGEWAGESITELVGDMVEKWSRITGVTDDEVDEYWQSVADEYERGHADGQAAIFGKD